MVYIAEAHAIDGFFPKAGRGSPIVEEPETNQERMQLAGRCMVSLSIADITAVVDTIDDPTLKAWAAWPDRLFLIDKAGSVVYAGGKGPWGFKPDELEAAIRKELAVKGE